MPPKPIKYIADYFQSVVGGRKAKKSELTKQIGTDYYVLENSAIGSGQLFDESLNIDEIIERDGFQEYKKMLTDAQVNQSLWEKKLGVVSADWDVVPASDDKKDIEIADFCRYNLQKMPGTVTDSVLEMLDSMAFGFMVGEKIWNPVERGEYVGKWLLAQLKWQDPEEIEFELEPSADIKAVFQDQPTGVPIELPMDKVVIYVYRPQFGRPWGQSDLRAAYKHWWSKDFLLKFWNIHLETHGMPTRVAKFPPGNTNNGQRNDLQDVVDQMQNNTAITMPNDFELELIQVTNKAGFEAAIRYHDRMIHKNIMGQTLSSDEGERSGSLALGREHGETKEDYVSALRKNVAEFITEKIIKDIVDFNYADVDEYPRFKWIPRKTEIVIETVEDLEKALDTGLIQESDYNVLRKRMGLSVSDKYDDQSDVVLLSPKTKAEIASKAAVAVEDVSEAKEENSHRFSRELYSMAIEDDIPETPGRPFTSVELAAGGMEWYARERREAIDAETNMVAELSPIFADMRRQMILDVKKKVFSNGKVNELALKNLTVPKKQYAEYLTTASKIIHNDFLARYRQTLLNTGVDVKGVPTAKKLARGRFERYEENKREFYEAQIQLEQAPDEAALAEIDRLVVDGDYAAASALRAEVAESLAKQTARTFFITDVTNETLLKETKDAIRTGMKFGRSEREIVKSISSIFDAYTYQGAANDPYRLKTIVRTNITDVANAADLAAYEDPEAIEFTPMLEYSAILDGVTTDICKSLDGKVLMANDPAWSWMRPPNHFNCRSRTIPIAYDDPRVEKGPDRTPSRSIVPKRFGGDE